MLELNASRVPNKHSPGDLHACQRNLFLQTPCWPEEGRRPKNKAILLHSRKMGRSCYTPPGQISIIPKSELGPCGVSSSWYLPFKVSWRELVRICPNATSSARRSWGWREELGMAGRPEAGQNQDPNSVACIESISHNKDSKNKHHCRIPHLKPCDCIGNPT